jgi:glycosyltransferase involved in cell wall biosynthesis
LPDNLRSVAAQSYSAIEHVVMDGGSTDGSVEILSAASPPVIWESGPDQGQSDAINKAFARSTGSIIGWLNSDDAYFSRDAVARAVGVFDKHPSVGVVYGHAVLVNGSGTLLYVLWAPRSTGSLLRWYNFICQPTAFVRRSVVEREGLVDPAFEYMMDRELWRHLATRTRFHRLNQIVAIDRHQLQRKSYTRLDLAALDQALFLQRYRAPRASSSRLFVKGMKLGLRVAGLSMVAEAARGSDALTLDVPSASTIAIRQVAQLRSWMPWGDT